MIIGGEGIEVHQDEIGNDVIRVCDVLPAYVTGLTAALDTLTNKVGDLEDRVSFLKFTLFLLSNFVVLVAVIGAIVLR